MRADILDRGRMTVTGSAFKDIMKLNSIPALDLFVRESVQNSLDAAAEQSGLRYVEVSYLTGSFRSGDLSRELEHLDTGLKDWEDKECEYIAVRDVGTEGLTGEYEPDKIQPNKYGNIYKLVYDILKPQDKSGAGGSWGIGKTVYYKMGKGLVIYYSRIMEPNSSTYGSRLAVALVQDEKADVHQLLSNEKCPAGIAWWGKRYSPDSCLTGPETDEEYIKKFLTIFGIEPYSGNETGTTIIIPYTDNEGLLSDHRINRGEERHEYNWETEVGDYLRVAVQRWYAPRLNNTRYRGRYLKVRINGEKIEEWDSPSLELVQKMYNRAICSGAVESCSGQLSAKFECQPIKYSKYVGGRHEVGKFVYALVDRHEMMMTPPENLPSPYAYYGAEEDENSTLICYVRKPGMIVEYSTSWVSNSKLSLPEDRYFIGIFVLNSDALLKEPLKECRTVEDYFRGIEESDHHEWKDVSRNGVYLPGFVGRIQTEIKKILRANFSEKKEPLKLKNSDLGVFLAEKLLPPNGFGKRASAQRTLGRGSEQNSVRRKKTGFEIDYDGIEYESATMKVPLCIRTKEKNQEKHLAVFIMSDSEQKKVGLDEWENSMGLPAPFYIDSLVINVKGGVFKQNRDEIVVTSDKPEEYSGIRFAPLRTRKGTCYGVDIILSEPADLTISITAAVELRSRDIKPVFYCNPVKEE